jgi:hypothetical protein
MSTTKTKQRYFLAINVHRTSTDNGFSNTWSVMECLDKSHQRRVLTLGLPVTDRCILLSDGTCKTSYSTTGIRIAHPSEIREAKREESLYGAQIEQVQEHVSQESH